MAIAQQFLRCERGVIATEFALVAPVMVLLWVGLVELGTAHMVAHKVEIAAQSAADIVAQDEFTDDDKLADMDVAIRTILFPYDLTRMGYRISSFVGNTDDADPADWTEAGGDVAVAEEDPEIANDLNSETNSVIVVTVSYTHEPVLLGRIIGESIFGDSLTFRETVFAKPRLVPVIPKLDAPED